MHDRTTKLLLSLIAVALWALLLRPALMPTPAHAQAERPIHAASLPRFSAPVLRIPENGQGIYVVDNAGWVYRLDRVTLEIQRSVRLMPKE